MRCQVEKTLNSLVWSAHHGEGLATSSLPIGEAGCVGSLEGTADERLHCFLIDLKSGYQSAKQYLLIIISFVKYVVKAELVRVDVFREIKFLPKIQNVSFN